MANKFLNGIDTTSLSVNSQYSLPTSDGSNKQVLTTDGNGNVTFSDVDLVGAQAHYVYHEVKNSTGVTIPKGTGVMAVGTDGNSGHILISPMVADGSIEPQYFIGITADAIGNGQTGNVIHFGMLSSFDTTAFNDGDVLYCDPANDGGFTVTEPDGPNLKLAVAFIVNSATNGKMFIRVQGNEGLHQLHDVSANPVSTADGDLLQWNATSKVWENKTLADIADSRYVNVSGDQMTGDLTVGTGSSDNMSRVYFSDGSYTEMRGYGLQFNRGAAYLRPTTNGDKTMYFGTASAVWSVVDYHADAHNFHNGSVDVKDGNIQIDNVTVIDTSRNVTATSFIRSGGTSSQFLKADGSVDSNTYLTSYSETDTLDTVADRGSTTDQTLTVGGLITTSGEVETPKRKRFYVNLPNGVDRWYKIANVNQGNSGISIRGALNNHVENFGTQRLDLTIFGREGDSGGNIEVTGRFEVAYQGVGLRIMQGAASGSYTTYDVYVRCTKYTQAELDVYIEGTSTSVDWFGDTTYVTTEPSGTVEFDNTSQGQGSYLVEASSIKTVADRDWVNAQGYLTSLPSHNHDSVYVNVSGDNMTGALGMGFNSVYWGGGDDYNSSINYVDNAGGDHYFVVRTKHNGVDDNTLTLHANSKLATFSGSIQSQTVYPSVNATYNLGTTSRYWNNSYIKNYWVDNAIYFGGGNNYLNWTNSRVYSNVGIESGTGFYGDGSNLSNVDAVTVDGFDSADLARRLYSYETGATPEEFYTILTLPYFSSSGWSRFYYFDVYAFEDISDMNSQLHYRVYLHNRGSGTSNNIINASVFKVNEGGAKFLEFKLKSGGSSNSQFFIKAGEDYSRLTIVAMPFQAGYSDVTFSTQTTEPSGFSAITWDPVKHGGKLEIGSEATGGRLTINTAIDDIALNAINLGEPAFRFTLYNDGSSPVDSNTFHHGLFYNSIENTAIHYYRGGSTTGGFMTFTTDNGTERMRIRANGNININNGLRVGSTAEPSYTLQVDGNAYVNSTMYINGATTIDDALTITSTTPLEFTGTGSGTYNKSVVYSSNDGLVFEAPLESDLSTADQRPIILTWRGGFASKGGMTLDGSVKIYTKDSGMGLNQDTPSYLMHINSIRKGLYVRGYYSYGQENYAIKVDGTSSRSGGYIGEAANVGGLALSSGAWYYGAGLYQTDANSTTFSSILIDNGEIEFLTDSGLTANSTFYPPTRRLHVTTNGNIGIGLSGNPDDKLDVNGRIRARSGYAGTDGEAKEYFWISNNTGNSGTIWRKIGTFNAGQSARIKIEAVGVTSYGSGTIAGKTTILAQVNNNNQLEGKWFQEGLSGQQNAVYIKNPNSTTHEIYFNIGAYSEYAFEALISDGTFTPDATTVSAPTGGYSLDRQWNVNSILWLNSSDNVSIGTSDPEGFRLLVNGNVKMPSTGNRFSGHFYYDPYDANGNHYPHFTDGSNQNGVDVYWRLYNGASLIYHRWGYQSSTFGNSVGINMTGSPAYPLDVSGTIRATGDVIAYSDVRVKENIKTIDGALDKVLSLRGVQFNKKDEVKKSVGVIAQEIEQILPEVVHEDANGMKSVAYGNIVGVLIEAIKEQQKQIDELKAMINGNA